MRTIPSVRRGTPEQSEAGEYRQLEVNGATVHVHNSLQDLAQVEIDVESSVFGSKLVLRGIEENNKGCCG